MLLHPSGEGPQHHRGVAAERFGRSGGEGAVRFVVSSDDACAGDVADHRRPCVLDRVPRQPPASHNKHAAPEQQEGAEGQDQGPWQASAVLRL